MEEKAGEQTSCISDTAYSNTMKANPVIWYIYIYIYIWGIQAKALGNIHWAVISIPRADICLFFKSAKKEGQLALTMEMEFSIEMGSTINTHN